MNDKTKQDMLDFLKQIESLSVALSPFIGFQTATRLQSSAVKLQLSLEQDETILDLQ